ncbi:MAG: low molecular weight protein-tyrosine-phosphatase [Thiolinea sp.]
MEKVSVLFVCMGNICRSPTAHGIFESLVAAQGLEELIIVDSAGTHAYHVGEAPDRRSQQAAMIRGIDLSAQRARQVESADFGRFQYILAMDQDNLRGLKSLAGAAQNHNIHLFMEFAQRWEDREVPDPYYGGERGFERVLDMVEDAAEGLLAHIRQQHFS